MNSLLQKIGSCSEKTADVSQKYLVRCTGESQFSVPKSDFLRGDIYQKIRYQKNNHWLLTKL